MPIKSLNVQYENMYLPTYNIQNPVRFLQTFSMTIIDVNKFVLPFISGIVLYVRDGVYSSLLLLLSWSGHFHRENEILIAYSCFNFKLVKP